MGQLVPGRSLYGRAARVTLRYVSFAIAPLCLAAAAAATGLAAVSSSQRTYTTGSTRPLRTALFDTVHLNGPKAEAFALTRSAGAQYVRLMGLWNSIAPTPRPAGFDPSDPTSPGYSWGALDATVEAAEAAGLTPIVDIFGAPKWADAKLPSGVNGGSPRIAELGAFAQAIATHYDGEGGGPVVNDFEVWNEPNLSLDLAPASASTYRKMVNAVAAPVHAVDPNNLVVAGGLDPFGHKKSKKQTWYSIAPLTFMRSLLCLSNGAHPHATCDDPVQLDVWSHHPYTYGGPFGTAKTPGDVELGNLSQMRTVLHAAVADGHVVSTHPVDFWVTEFGWDSRPPRKGAAPMPLAARWTAESLYQAWRSGASLLTWFGLEDQRSPSVFQSGLYFHTKSLDDPRPKLLLTAFRFPFVAYLHRGAVSVWGRDATSTSASVTIQFRHAKSGKWRTIGDVVTNDGGVFQATMKVKASKKDWLRAVAPDSGTSLAFSLTRPHDPHIGPFG